MPREPLPPESASSRSRVEIWLGPGSIAAWGMMRLRLRVNVGDKQGRLYATVLRRLTQGVLEILDGTSGCRSRPALFVSSEARLSPCLKIIHSIRMMAFLGDAGGDE